MPKEYQGFVLEKYRAVYFVTPKVANTTLKQVFCDLLEIPTPKGPHAAEFPRVKKIDDYRDYFKFCFVRNPWDKTVSCYFDKIVKANKRSQRAFSFLRKKKVILNNTAFHKDMKFHEFVEVVCQLNDNEADAHIRSQHCLLSNESGLFVDFVGKHERFQEDFAKVCERIGIERISLPNKTTSDKAKDHREYYDAHTRELIRQRYARDIELFGYDF